MYTFMIHNMKKGRNMKRFLSILLFLSVCCAAVFADEEGDEYDDGYVYQQNGSGDQFLKINLFANFPLSFDGQLYVGGGADLGYYRFLNSWLAVGGEVTVTDNISIGNKPLIQIPITFGAMFQPVAGKFEFPQFVTLGIATETWQSRTFFPSFALKLTSGAYYRFAESWSAGLSLSLMWLPQYFSEDSRYNQDGVFLTTALGVRYHF